MGQIIPWFLKLVFSGNVTVTKWETYLMCWTTGLINQWGLNWFTNLASMFFLCLYLPKSPAHFLLHNPSINIIKCIDCGFHSQCSIWIFCFLCHGLSENMLIYKKKNPGILYLNLFRKSSKTLLIKLCFTISSTVKFRNFVSIIM